MSTVEVTSFGYHWGGPPAAGMTFDLREHFRDPHWDDDRSLRELTGLDAVVRQVVLATPGVRVLVRAVMAAVAGYAQGPHGLVTAVAVGCAGGRHRSVAVTQEIAVRLTIDGHDVTVRHRDIGRPVVRRDTPAAGQ